LIGAEEAGQQYADLADAVLAALWQPVADQFAAKHGPMPGRGAMVLGMGSLGARRLNATSDLDLIVIYDADGVEASEGRRPLAARPYYARFTQALVTALSAPMAQGRLYEVDMRLRPSGTQGPVATSLASFRNYQQNEAWTWEHLALTRARPVTGTPDLMSEVEAFRQTVLATEANPGKVAQDVADMRARIAAAKAPDGPWDAKIGAGRLQDIELLSQTGALLAGSPRRTVAQGLQAGVAIGWLSGDIATELARSYRLCWQVQLASKLLSGQTIDPDQIGEGGRAFLLRETGATDIEALQTRLTSSSDAAAPMIEEALASTDTIAKREA
jgi:glutamate-ammonia-ligase adenylyltransferase